MGDRRHERLVLFVLAVAQFINIIDFVIVMPLGSRLMRTLEISPQQFGLIVSSYTFSAAAAGLLAALFIDRFDRKSAFLTVLTGFSLGTLCCAPRRLPPAAGGPGGDGRLRRRAGRAGDDDHRRCVSRRAARSRDRALMSAFAVASVVGVPLGLSLSYWFDSWHAPFWMLGIPSLLVLALAARLLPRLRGHLTAQRPGALVEIYDTVRRPVHLRALALIMLLVVGAFLVVPYLPTSLVDNVGISESRLPWVYVVGGCAALFSSPVVGRLADRMGRLALYCFLATVSGLMMLTASLLPPGTPAPLVIGALTVAGLMVANSGRMIVAMTMINAAVVPRHRGSFMSLNSAMQHLGSGLVRVLGGRIIERSESGQILHYGVVGAIAAVTAISSIALAAGLRPYAATLPEGDAEDRELRHHRSAGRGCEPARSGLRRTPRLYGPSCPTRWRVPVRHA